MMPVVAPETWYRAWWILWTLAALIAGRLVFVNPILRSQERTRAEQERTTIAIERLTEALSAARIPREITDHRELLTIRHANRNRRE